MQNAEIVRQQETLTYANAGLFLTLHANPMEQYISNLALGNYKVAWETAPNDQKEGVIQTAILHGDLACVHASNTIVDFAWFVANKVLPYLPIYRHEIEGERSYSLDKTILRNVITQSLEYQNFRKDLDKRDTDPKRFLQNVLTYWDKNGFSDPLKKYLLATYTNDHKLIDQYAVEAENCPSRELDDLVYALSTASVQVQKIIQQGDSQRYHPKDGYLFLGEHHGKEFVFKELIPAHTDCSRLDGMTTEDTLLQRLCHPGIVAYHGTIESLGHRFLVEDYISSCEKPNGNLAVNEELRQLTEILTYLRTQNVLYLDIKSKNILFDGARYILVDFGWAQQKRSVNYTETSTPRYVAPELYLSNIATEKSEIFALGVYCYERLTGQHPFTPLYVPQRYEVASLLHYATANCLESIIVEPLLPYGEFGNFILSMLEKIPENRPTLDEVIRFTH